jgi:hypothetical protein
MTLLKPATINTPISLFASIVAILCSAQAFAASTIREKKSISILGGAGYLLNSSVNPPAAVHGEIDLIVGKKIELAFGVDYFLGTPAFETFEKSRGSLTSSATIYSASAIAKFYLINSFNIGAGAFFRNYLANATAETTELKSEAEITSQSMGLAAAIGNKWVSKSGWTFGIDWARVEYELSNTSSTSAKLTSKTGGTIIPELETQARIDAENDALELTKTPTIQVGVVKLGISF